jgi:hypothetical protein
MAESTVNTKLRTRVSGRALTGQAPELSVRVWGCRPPSLVVLLFVKRHLFQEPCTLGGHLAGSFSPFLHPSPPICTPHGNGDPPPAFATPSTETIDFSIEFGFAALIYVSL